MIEIRKTPRNGTQGGRPVDEIGRLAALRRYEILDTEPESDFDEITALVRTIFGTSMAAISLIDADRQWFKSRLGALPGGTTRDAAFCHHTIQNAEGLAVRDAQNDPRFASSPLVTGEAACRCYLGIPLTTPDGYSVGALCVLDTTPRDFTEEEATLLRRFAHIVVKQMELRRIASRDGLTGVLTRRAFEERVWIELSRYKRHGDRAVLAVFDLDRFKGINDTYGHPVGDAVLKATVAACAQELRAMDCIGRLGGEEFGVLLAGVGAPEAAEALRRLRAVIEAAAIPDYPDLHFTASFGAAQCDARFESTAQWFAEADRRLYAAKRAGRNCCVVQTDAPPLV